MVPRDTSIVCFLVAKVLERDSQEFHIIQQYVKNTHAATHGQYDLNMQQVSQSDKRR